jgi:hypothetical protein
MFKFLKRKRHDPEAIANVVLASASEPGIFSAFWKEFTVSDDQNPRVLFGVVIFAYCWSRGWASGTKDSRVWEAYDRAAGIIALRFKDPAKLVRIMSCRRLRSPISISNSSSTSICKFLSMRIPHAILKA